MNAAEYFARVWGSEIVDRPGGLWRRRGDDTEYLSLIDWEWHRATDPDDLPHPDLLVPIDAEQLQLLLGDRQRFHAATAERLIQECRGISEATDLRVHHQEGFTV